MEQPSKPAADAEEARSKTTRFLTANAQLGRLRCFMFSDGSEGPVTAGPG